ncbi:MAG: hypothetical protein ABEJ83_02335 [Candidatus Nanohaloarchaea archaeon]
MLDFSDRERDEFPEHAEKYLENESGCVIQDQKGFIRNSRLPDFPFRVRKDGFDEKPADFDTSVLEKRLDDKFGLVSDIDV